MDPNSPITPPSLTSPSALKIMGGGLGLATSMVANYMARKPMSSRLPLHLAFITIGYGLGAFSQYSSYDRILQRELYINDYIRRHPEDFPPEERRKYAEVFTAWLPNR